MEYLGYYCFTVVLANALFISSQAGANDARVAFVMALLWPLVIPFAALVYGTDRLGWDFDVAKGKWIGFRRPDDNWPGFAISFMKVEFQLWKKRA